MGRVTRGIVTKVFRETEKTGFSRKTNRPWTLKRMGFEMETEEGVKMFNYSTFQEKDMVVARKRIVRGNTLDVSEEPSEVNGKEYWNAKKVEIIGGEGNIIGSDEPQPFPDWLKVEWKTAKEETKELIPDDGYGGFIPFTSSDILVYILLKKLHG